MREVFWIRTNDGTKLAIVTRPRGDAWLEADLMRLRGAGIEGIVSLLTVPEEQELGLAQEPEACANLGLSFFPFPIPDRTAPCGTDGFLPFVAKLAAELKRGRALGIHCRGSIGRATITAAALMVELGWSADAALSEIEEARGCLVPDTAAQKAWILALRSPYSTR